mgnify:FL=1
MAGKTRNFIADVIVGLVILVVAWWLLNSVIGSVLWLVRLGVVVALIVGALYLASRIRGK